MGKFDYGQKILDILKEGKMKQVDLARKLKVTPGFVNQLILGRRKPGRDTLFKVAEALGVPLEELLPQPKGGRGIPLFFKFFTGRAFCEYKPQDWKAHKDTISEYLPLPPHYRAERAEEEKIFAVSIEDNRLYPLLRKGMKIYLKPVLTLLELADEVSKLCLYRDEEGNCSFCEVEIKDNIVLRKDLLDSSISLYKSPKEIKGSLYKVINIDIPS